MNGGCHFEFFIRIFFKNSSIFLAPNAFTRVNLYIFEIVVSSGSFKEKTQQIAFIVRLFDLTVVEAKE